MTTDPSLVAPAERVGTGALLAGRYRVGLRIGAGGMGSIHHAHDLLLGRDVAVKFLHPHLADDHALRERFREEARHAAGLLHPNVVTVFDTGVDDLPYIVMELVDGPSLRDVLLARGPLDPVEATRLVGAVCTALARAHGAGIVHRDVKPENVLVAMDEEGGETVKVADFGIARAVTEAGPGPSEALIGSVHYLAPELIAGHAATPASDQYAVGVLLYELVTGQRPLPADTPEAVALRHASEPVPPPSAWEPTLPEALDRVVARATALAPHDRFADVRELAAALRDAVAGLPERPRSEAQPRHGGGPRDRPQRADGTLVIPPDALLTATALARTQVRDRVYAPAPRRFDRVIVGAVLAVVAAVGLGGWALFDRVLPPDGAVPQAPAQVALPEVGGQPADQALATLRAAPYELAVVTRDVPNAEVPAGVAVGTDPPAGESVPAGSEVVVEVSTGPSSAEVPDVVGLPRDQAVARLQAAGLQVAITEAYRDDEIRLGRVASQAPGPGGDVERGDAVVLVVSLGPATVRVPDVRGQTVETAVDRLETAGFEVVVVEQRRPRTDPLSTDRVGYVEDQDPGPLGRLARGGQITLTTYT